MPDRTVDVAGVSVAFTDRGTGEPVLLLHGNPDSRHGWDGLLAKLGESYRCVAPDFPGFGDSKPLPAGITIGPAAMAEFWDRFADAVAIESPAHVVVHDFGGPWLLPWVVAHPERVASICLLNTVFHRDYSWHGWARVWQKPLLGELAMLLTTRMVFRREMAEQAPGVPRSEVDAAYDRMHRTMRRTVLRTYRDHARPERVFEGWEARLLAVLESKPARVIWGDRDPYIPSSFADRFGVRAIHLPEYGHWAHMEAPGVVAQHVDELLAGRAATGSEPDPVHVPGE